MIALALTWLAIHAAACDRAAAAGSSADLPLVPAPSAGDAASASTPVNRSTVAATSIKARTRAARRQRRAADSLTVVTRTRPHEGTAPRGALASRTTPPDGAGSLLSWPTPHHPHVPYGAAVIWDSRAHGPADLNRNDQIGHHLANNAMSRPVTLGQAPCIARWAFAFIAARVTASCSRGL